MAIEKPTQANTINKIEREEESDEISFSKRGRCCFWIPCLRNSEEESKNNISSCTTFRSILLERIRVAEREDKWWVKGLRLMKIWTEMVAVPKWKSFIRRFNKERTVCCSGSVIGGGDAIAGRGKFYYDPISYSLNFDEGIEKTYCDDYGDDECVCRRDFASRFGAVPSSAKSSMDFGEVCASKAQTM